MPLVPPETPKQKPRSLFARLFVAFYLGVQGVLIATAGGRADHAYGFWMFHESSTVELALVRVLPGGTRSTVSGGKWEAMSRAGRVEIHAFRERVLQPELSTFGPRFSASYGLSATLERLGLALADLSAHTGDVDTCRFEIEIRATKNGRVEPPSTLKGPWRCTGEAPP